MRIKILFGKWLAVATLALGASIAVCQNVPPLNITNLVQSNAVPVGSISNAIAAAPGADALSAQELAHKKYVHETIQRLAVLQMNSDSNSLAAIVAELKNPDQQIRAAALKASIEFDDRSVIPDLQKIADQTEDPREKVEILNAIDYIKLPSLTEVIEARNAARAARKKTNAPPVLTSTNNLPAGVKP